MAEGELNLIETLGRIKSSLVTDRSKAVADLKHILRYNENSHQIDTLSHKTWHSIFEALFQYVASERSAYLKTKRTQKNTVYNRLEACAGVLRTAVEVGVGKLRIRTVKAVLEHVIQTLPTPEGFCEPLSPDYVKSMRSILEYQPHVEHLRDTWNEVLTFCLNSLDSFDELCAEESSSGFGNGNLSTTRTSSGTPLDRHNRPSRYRMEADELIACVRQLCRSPNAPIQDLAQESVATLVRYLQQSSSAGRPQVDALSAINLILARASHTNIELTRQATRDILPLLAELWVSKSPHLRNEILSAMILTRSYVSDILRKDLDAEIKSSVGTLLEVLQGDYSKRPEREQLRLDDLRLRLKPTSTITVAPPDANVFRLRNGNVDSEARWTMVYFMALYCSLLDQSQSNARSISATGETPRKRLRISTNLREHLHHSTSGTVPSQTSSLQIVSFMSTVMGLTVDQLDTIIRSLTALISDKVGSIAIWTMLALAGCAMQKVSNAASLSQAWLRVWQLASRAISSQSTAQAASYLLNVLLDLKLVQYHSVSQSLEYMLSMSELTGPGVLAESSAEFWVTFLRIKLSENPGSAGGTSERLLRWIFSKWSPSSFDDRSYSSQAATDIRSIDILRLFSLCTGRQLISKESDFSFVAAGPVSQTWIRHVESIDLDEYLLLTALDADFLQQPSARAFTLADLSVHHDHSDDAMHSLIVEFCSGETDRAYIKFKEFIEERPQSITSHVIHLLATLCLVNDKVLAAGDLRQSSRVQDFQKLADRLSNAFFQYLASRECEQEKIDAALSVVAEQFSGIGQLQMSEKQDPQTAQAFFFITKLSRVLESRRQVQESVMIDHSNGNMDIDDAFESQASISKPRHQLPNSSRDHVMVNNDIASFRSSIALYISYVDYSFEGMDLDGETDGSVSPFVEHLVELSPAELCSCRTMLGSMFSSSIKMSDADLDALFEHFTGTFLQGYVFERHEVGLSLCLDILTLFAAEWTNAHTTAAGEFAREAYGWFINVALPNNLSSSHVDLGIVNMVFALLKIHGPEFKPSDAVVPVQTTIFALLEHGDPFIRYRVAQELPQLFNHFPLGQHEGIFQEIFVRIPISADWAEGMAIRLLVLSELASSWNTLLRRCIYHIFETAGLVSRCAAHACYCIKGITAALGLESGHALFRLFAPQLLFTWLEKQPIASIPYTVFAYASLSHLLRDVQDEAIAQVLMRSTEDELDSLAEKLGKTKETILENSFAKVAAYALAYDTENKGTNVKKPSSEAKIRGVLGNETHIGFLENHYPKIVSIFIQTINGDSSQSLIKNLSKDPRTKESASVLAEMIQISSSNRNLPADQQPCFHPLYLTENLKRLGRRIRIEPGNMWSQPLYVFALRYLLQAMHPALGSLHSCSILRKIRTLIALAGPASLSGYPLEMTLHALRPLLTDQQCAEDALGIVQYLLTRGTEWLCTRVSFVCGFVVSTLISLQRFLGPSSVNATEESDRQTASNKVRAFRNWLFDTWCIQYESVLQQTRPEDKKIAPFRSMTKAAFEAHAQANSVEATPESRLIQELLEDHRNGLKLMDGPAHDLVFGSLCSEFSSPPSYRHDILGPDVQAAKFATEIWETCRGVTTLSNEYLLWVGRVLGRAYNHLGWSEKVFCDPLPRHIKSSGGSNDSSSEARIHRAVVSILRSGNRIDAGLAEDSLRLMFSVPNLKQLQVKEEGDFSISLIHSLHLPTSEDRSYVGDPVVTIPAFSKRLLKESLVIKDLKAMPLWVRDIAVSLVTESHHPLLPTLARLLFGVEGLAVELLSPIIHLALLEEPRSEGSLRKAISATCRTLFQNVGPHSVEHIKVLLQAILYLRKQSHPLEDTVADRDNWLDLDYTVASRAAEFCGLHTAALMLAETSIGSVSRPFQQSSQSSRRSSMRDIPPPPVLPEDLLISIYRNIEEPDSFYGVHRSTSLLSVLERLDYEKDGLNSLLFHGARLDSEMRRGAEDNSLDTVGIIHSLSRLNLNSVIHTLLQNDRMAGAGRTVDNVLQTARNLEQWDVRAPEVSISEPSVLFKALQGINNAPDQDMIRKSVDIAILNVLTPLLKPDHYSRSAQASYRTLGILAEIDDVTSATSLAQVEDAWQNMRSRQEWMSNAEIESSAPHISARETLFGILSKNTILQNVLHINEKDARRLHVESLLESCRVAQKQGASRQSLATATYLSDLVPLYQECGIDAENAVQEVVADILWAQGEQGTSIRMLQQLTIRRQTSPEKDSLHESTILAKLGHHTGDARSENAEEIMQNYLKPAIAALKGKYKGPDAGLVLHEFAFFCDKQLQNPDARTDFERVTKAKERRKKEVEAYQTLIKSAKGRPEVKDKHTKEYKMAKRWFEIDEQEYQRMSTIRQSLVAQCLENYLRSLTAWDQFDNDVLRFFSVWLECSKVPSANETVAKHLSKVPSAKFAVLMNQLSSILQNDKSQFQELLQDLLLRVCTEHPFHSLHHIFAGSNTSSGGDEMAKSRKSAFGVLATKLSNAPKEVRREWMNLSATDTMYHKLAMYTDKDKTKLQSGREVPLESTSPSNTLMHKIKEFRVPPATLSVPLRADKDYRFIPRIVSFKPKMTIASGISCPKILTAIGSDGQHYKQLFKGGNDDLRQDAIMEQVFEQVSQLLGKHTATRQRKLHIRTYKVLPLSAHSGIMEFVQNTIPLSDYLQPAHRSYYPNDISWNDCRTRLHNITQQSTDINARVKVFKEVISKFHPVMRYFFLERFDDPDDWFAKRLAYTRATAAISILGHILGLGDRHCHNILLDQKTGEAVHIDLGIAFEAGRILPMPEVIPFRLTRDIVDAMGYTKTEGVFRRCCEFTLEALRDERESIMTLLNVLQYDPLVNWTVSPLRAKRMQDMEAAERGEVFDEMSSIGAGPKSKDDGGHAGRALSVVEKKLSKTLSIAATVSELIQQATDERNLAVLYPGWSAWA